MIPNVGPYRAWAAILGELAWREELRLPPPTWGELDTAIGAVSSRHHVEQLKQQGFLVREPGQSRGLRLTDKGRAAARQVEYRVHSQGEGVRTWLFNGPRRYAERKLQELRQTMPDERHWLAIALDGGEIDWNSPELGSNNVVTGPVFDDVFDEMASNGVSSIEIVQILEGEAPWRIIMHFRDGSQRTFSGSTRYDVVLAAWESTFIEPGRDSPSVGRLKRLE